VHLWRASLSPENDQRWRGTLTSREQERADRFHFPADRRRFTVTRALLRTLLGRYLQVSPESLRFDCNAFGKPSLPSSQNPRGITFNVAHSGDCSLLAFAMATDLGVDVEHVELQRDLALLARAVFSPSQYAAFLALPDAMRTQMFFAAWTRKEAIVKALGGGLSISPDGIELGEDGTQWTVRNIGLGDHYVAAIAVRSRNLDLRLWDWTNASGAV
jgi:4'-phosphopantetheinyl transferase